MLDKSKEEIIRRMCFDPAGFGSIKNTLKDVRKIDKSITEAEVKEFIENNTEKKTNLKGYNSFIANEPKQEYQVDLFFMSKDDESEYNEDETKKKQHHIGMLFIDIFTKYCQVVVINSKKNEDILAGLLEGLNKMGGNPQVIYSDDEPSFTTKDFQELLEERKIKHIITRGHAAVAEATIRTIKNMINKRLEAAKQPESKWIDILNQVLFVYNCTTEHSATKMTPMQAREPKNLIKVKLNLEFKRKAHVSIQMSRKVVK